MKRIILILILIPVLFLSGSSAPAPAPAILAGSEPGTISLPSGMPETIPNDIPDRDTDGLGEPYNPDYTTWQQDVRDVMMNLQDVPEDYFEPAEEAGTLMYFSYQTKNYDKDMEEETKFAIVYIPYGYSSYNQYDILYLMHGYTGDIETWLGSPEEPNEIKNLLDHMIQDQMIEPMIVVCPTYYDNNENELTDNMDTGLLEPFGQELRNDLMPAIESTFSTYADTVDEQGLQASSAHRAFGGFSMGGVTTLYRMMDCMDLFSSFIDLSGPIYWSNLVNSETGDWGASYLKDRITEEGYSDNDFYLYMATGTKDEAYPLMDMMVQSMLRQNDFFHVGEPGQDGINVTYGVCDGEIHDWHNCARCLYNILPMASDHMNGKDLAQDREEDTQDDDTPS
ncbi:MAG: alpha/beta hydrolase [Lactimicrobium massiliense]